MYSYGDRDRFFMRNVEVCTLVERLESVDVCTNYKHLCS
jgi:hypothetical protein